MLDDPDSDDLARRLGQAAKAGGQAILKACAAGIETIVKPDGSPVTSADLASQTAILEALAALLPGVPVIAEETALPAVPPDAFILVDPLDGTRDFVAGRDEYAVNIAYISDGKAIAGAILAPATGDLWLAGSTAIHVAPDGRQTVLRCRAAPQDGLVALLSRSHGDPRCEAFLSGLPVGERRASGSAIKFARIADGSADLYVRFGRTLEWDTAAGLCLIRAAGGTMLELDGRTPGFGRADRGYVNRDFVAFGDPQTADRLLRAGVSALAGSA